jgi:transposase
MNKKQLDESLKNHVINPYKRNYKICDIAKIYQVTNKTIYNIIDKYNTTQTVQRKKGSGGKQDEYIFNILL